MKVVHLLDSSYPHLSGYAVRSHHIIENQNKYCESIGITSPYYDYTGSKQEIDHSVYHRTLKSAKSKVIEELKIPFLRHILIERDFQKQAKIIIDEFKPDIIHAHSNHRIGICGYHLANQCKVPFVYEVRGLWEDTRVSKGLIKEDSFQYKYHKNRETFLAGRCDKLVVISESLKDDMIKRSIPADKIIVVPNGVLIPNYDESRIESLKEQYNLQDSTVLGYVGSLNQYESLDMLLEVIARLKNDSCGNVKGLIVGAGPEYDHLIKLSHELGIKDSACFTGKVEPDEIYDYYKLIDVFVLARRAARETNLVTPLKPYEAMEAGLCLLMSDLPASREIIQENKTGMMFKDSSKDDLYSKCRRLIQDDSLRRQLGQTAREWVLANRKWDQVVAGYLPVYEELINLND
jgi:glycosyltransferase involved in cell wall biosynthesis